MPQTPSAPLMLSAQKPLCFLLEGYQNQEYLPYID
jgi:hypothetical protein